MTSAVAKLIIIDPDNKYLMMYRNNHPRFGDDPDLPGGIVEVHESTRTATIREVQEEIGVTIDEKEVREIYSGVSHSRHGTQYSLFVTKLAQRPAITISWEHVSYEWLTRGTFLETAHGANDTYMHMVYDVLKALPAKE